jgi:CheY-like chemotaxis protein
MALIALIDDDATEAMILSGMLEHGKDGHTLVHSRTLAAFGAAMPEADLVLLDRRLPPHDSFAEGVAALAATGWRGPVILISAYSEETAPPEPPGLVLSGPVSKGDLLTPEAIEAVLARALS